MKEGRRSRERRRRGEGKDRRKKRHAKGDQQKLEAELEEGVMEEDRDCPFLVRPGILQGKDKVRPAWSLREGCASPVRLAPPAQGLGLSHQIVGSPNRAYVNQHWGFPRIGVHTPSTAKTLQGR